ncbi:MAG: hypothetical protein ACREVY_02955 [Gammaproteobacteria bacterium]
MTLVAAASFAGVPLLLGDVLISAEGKPVRPSLTGRVPPEAGTRAIVGARRKLIRITPRLVVGWAGMMIAAEVVVKDLSAACQAMEPSREWLTGYLESYPDHLGRECELVGWLVDAAGPVSFHWHSKARRPTLDASPAVCGSGSSDFLAQFAAQETLVRPADPVEAAIRQGLAIAGHVLGIEFYTGANLRLFYGGAIETIYFNGTAFEQLDDVTFIFFQPDLDFTRRVIDPRVAKIYLHLRYLDDDYLVVDVTDSRDVPSGTNPRQECNILTPVHKKFTSAYQPRGYQSMRANRYCSFLYVPVSGLGQIVLVLVTVGNDDSGLIRFSQSFESGALSKEWLELSQRFSQEVGSALATVVSRFSQRSVRHAHETRKWT